MSMGHHILPSARRIDEKTRRYVRSEYGDRDSCWFVPCASTEGPLDLPGTSVLTKRRAAAGPDEKVVDKAVRSCPVMSALSENNLRKTACRCETYGER